MMDLHFHFQGSAKLPYKVTVSGAGDSLRIYCTCAAGTHGAFCKHAAAVLIGDVTNMLPGGNSPEDIAARSAPPRLLARAVAHNPQPKRGKPEQPRPLSADLAHDIAPEIQIAEQLGYTVRTNGDMITIFETAKSGKIKPKPTFIFERKPGLREHVVDQGSTGRWEYRDFDRALARLIKQMRSRAESR